MNESGQIFIFDNLKSLNTPFPKILFDKAKITSNCKIIHDSSNPTFSENSIEIWSAHEKIGFYKSSKNGSFYYENLKIDEKSIILLGKILKICCTPMSTKNNETKIAFLQKCAEKYELILTNLKLTKVIKCELKNKEIPMEIAFCGNENCAILYKNEIQIFDSKNSAIFKFNESWFSFISEIDGLRVFTTKGVFLLGKVPDCEEKIFTNETKNSAQYVIELYEKYINLDPCLEEIYKNPIPDEKTGLKSNDSRSGVISTNIESIISLIKYAGYQFDPQLQTFLLKAAEFSENVVPHDIEIRKLFQQIILYLDLLNEYRKLGRIITYEEFTEQTPEIMIIYALNQKSILLAEKVCNIFKNRGSEIVKNYLKNMRKDWNLAIQQKNENNSTNFIAKMTEIWKNSKNTHEFVEKMLINIGLFNNERLKNWLQTYQNSFKSFSGIPTVFKAFQIGLNDSKILDKSLLFKALQISEKYACILKLRQIAQSKDWAYFSEYLKTQGKNLKVEFLTAAKICGEFGNKKLGLEICENIKENEEKFNAINEIE